MEYTFSTVGKILFGRGAFAKLEELLPLGKRWFVVCGKFFQHSLQEQQLKDMAAKASVTLVFYPLPAGEPEPESIDAGVMTARDEECDAVLGIGGGSIMDTAKAIAGLGPCGEPVAGFLEGVGSGKSLSGSTWPFVAVPTTAGTGAEVTKNAVVASREHRFKKSFRSPLLLARAAVVDPLLTVNLPPEVTARSGMDAITQLIEAYTSQKATPFTDALCLYALRRAPALLECYKNGQNETAREDMSLCSLYSGLALANGGLGAAHGFAAGLGAFNGIPHGEACAVLLPHVMRLNLTAVQSRYAEVGRLLYPCEGKNEAYCAQAAIEAVEAMNNEMGIPSSLRYINIRREDIYQLVHASTGSSMSGNPVELTTVEMAEFIEYLL